MKKWLAEFLGTFALVFAGTGAIIADETKFGNLGHVVIALTFGLAILTMIYTFGDVSGAHFNPAVTIGFWFSKRFPLAGVGPYVLSQCLGAITASAIWKAIAPERSGLGVTELGKVSLGGGFTLEVIMTFFLMLTILSVSTGAKEKGITAGIAIGGVIALDALFGGALTGASMNPARSLAPALFTGHFKDLWLYLIAPVVGALLAVVAFRATRERAEW